MKTNKFLKLLQEERLKRMGRLVTKDNSDAETKEVNDNDLSLKELREKYPDIKARSKKEFLSKL